MSDERHQHADHEWTDLVLRAQAGDERAFRELAERCLPRMYRWAVSMTGDADEADDVTQVALLGMYRGLHAYRGESRFTTWLYRIVRNVMAERARTGARRAQRLTEHMPPPPAAAPPLAEHVDRGALTGLVHVYFAELPERQREIFDLVDLQGCTPTEAAALLELEPVTVRAHLFKARRTIRTRILERYPELVEEYRQ